MIPEQKATIIPKDNRSSFSVLLTLKSEMKTTSVYKCRHVSLQIQVSVEVKP